VQAAENELARAIDHDVTIRVDGPQQEEPGPAMHTGAHPVKGAAHYLLVGENDARVPHGFNLSVHGKQDHIRVEDIRWGWLSQLADGQLRGCTLRGNGTAALSGKGYGKDVIDCDVGRPPDERGPTDDYAILSIGTETVVVRGGVLRGAKAALKQIAGAVHVVERGVEIDAPEIAPGVPAPKGGVTRRKRMFVGGEEVSLG
jgi:hypothetical protein